LNQKENRIKNSKWGEKMLDYFYPFEYRVEWCVFHTLSGRTTWSI